MTLSRYYVGSMANVRREVFKSTTTPTAETHGQVYAGVIGPFKTRRGAEFMQAHGLNNPHIQNVADAERIAKSEQSKQTAINRDSHYVVGNGEPGCLYDGCAVVRTLDDAVEYLAEMFNLGRTRKANLKRSRYLSLNPARDGASYCEITHCNCSEPWIHDEMMTQEDWEA